MITSTLRVFLAVLTLLMTGAAQAERESSLLIKPDSMIGSNVGHFIDKQDRAQILQTLKSENSTKASNWKSNSSGIVFTVKPDMNESQQNACRDFTLDAERGSFQKMFSGTACREKNGNWVVVK